MKWSRSMTPHEHPVDGPVPDFIVALGTISQSTLWCTLCGAVRMPLRRTEAPHDWTWVWWVPQTAVAWKVDFMNPVQEGKPK